MATDNQNDFDEFDNLVEEGQTTDSFDSAPAVKPKKKSSGILIVFLLALVGVAGGAVWFLFLNPGAQTMMAPEQTAEMAAPVVADNALPPGVSPTEVPVDPNAAATPGVDPNAVAAPSPVDAAVVDPAAPVAPVDAVEATTPPVDGMTAEALPPPADAALMPTPETPVTDPNAPTATTDATSPAMPPVEQGAPVTPEAATGDTNMIAAQLPTPTTETAPAEAAVETPVDTATQPAVIAPVEAMPAQGSGQIDAASADRLNKIEQQLQEVSATLSAVQSATPTTQSADPAMNAALQALTEKLDALSKQVSDLDARTSTLAADMRNRAPSAEPAAMIAPIETNTAETPKQEATPEAIKPVEVKQEAPKKPVVKKAAPKPANTSGWELRGAQPGVAWLGRVGSGEMSRYSTGQSVPGLGVIQSVRQESGRWVVKASGGTVRE